MVPPMPPFFKGGHRGICSFVVAKITEYLICNFLCVSVKHHKKEQKLFRHSSILFIFS